MNQSDDFRSVSNERFTAKEKYILQKNKTFFSYSRKYLDIMTDIVEGKSPISIRALDWFVSNYSKKMNTVYKIRINNVISYFNVNIEYKNQLNSYSKKYFDPFCRGKKVIYSYRENDSNDDTKSNRKKVKPTLLFTSIGQLNFFHWAIRNKIIRYVENHLKEIEKDQKETIKRNNEEKLREQLTNEEEESSSEEDHSLPDPIICSSKSINSIYISSTKSKTSSNSRKSSDKSRKRRPLSKSIFDKGINKTNTPIVLTFD